MSQWIEWKGGERPVAPHTVVWWRARDGYEAGPVEAGMLIWEHGRRDVEDIVAYRVMGLGELTYREHDIVQWGIARNLIGPTGEATRVGQQAKTEEEVRELADAIAADDREAAKDAIGDVYVTLVMQAQMWGLTMTECIEAAWNQIKDRKGRMINGVFVKEADLPENKQ